MFGLTQEEYESIVFLTKCIYIDDLVYPSFLGFQHSVVLLTGLRMNLFIGKKFDLFVICGTNSFKDWVTNTKIALNCTPRQHQQALKCIIQHQSYMEKGKKLFIVGHSLGGSIATYCKSFIPSNDVFCITLNACPSKHLNANTDDDNILNLISKHDILNSFCNIIPGKNYMNHPGCIIIIPDNYKFPCVKSHCDFNIFMNFKI